MENFLEEIRLSLEFGQDVKLSGFGNFELRDKSSRPGRNPKKQVMLCQFLRAELSHLNQGKSYVPV